MKLLGQVITKELELSDEFDLNKSSFKSIWMFYNAYNLALCVTGIEDKKIKFKNRLWVKFITKWLDGEFDSKIYNKFKELMREDMAVIIESSRIINKLTKELGYDKGDTYKNYTVGCLSYDFPE